MNFRVSGKIVDTDTGKPVKGIAVSCDDDWGDPEVITSDDGEFVYESYGYPADKVVMNFEDSDGGENGWYFSRKEQVNLKKSESGTGTWDYGLYVSEKLEIKLTEDVPCMYGSPVVEFSVKGRVVDADSNPIPNIEVSHPEATSTVRTADDGTFDFRTEAFGFEMDTAILKFTDTDGEENGGDFDTEEVEVSLTQTNPGDGNWNFGEYSADNVEVVLDRKL
jgi:putative lipoprotein (rSAM/lipoprotein system)